MAHRPGMYFYPSLPCPGRDHHCPFSQPQDPLNTGLGCHNQLSGVDLSVDTYSVVTGRQGAYLCWERGFPAADQTHPSLQTNGGGGDKSI